MNPEEEPVIITFQDFVFRDPLLYGDFRNAMNEAEPRFYEDLVDYPAVHALFEEVKIFSLIKISGP